MDRQSSPHLLPELWDVHHAGVSKCAEWDRSGVALTAPCALRFRALTEVPVDGQSLQLLVSLSRESEVPPHSSHAILISTASRPPSDPRRRPFSAADTGVLILWDEQLLMSSSSTRGNSSTCLGARRGGGVRDELRLRIMLGAELTAIRHAGCGVGASSQYWEAPLILTGRRIFIHLLGLAPARAVGQVGRAVWGLAQLRETCQSAACDGGSRLRGSHYSECICGCLDSWEAFLPVIMHPDCFVPAPPGPPSAPPLPMLPRPAHATPGLRSQPPPPSFRKGALIRNISDRFTSTRPNGQREPAELLHDPSPAPPPSERAGDSDTGFFRLPALFAAAVFPPLAILFYWLRLKPNWVRWRRERKGTSSREHFQADREAETACLACDRDRQDCNACGLMDADGDLGDGYLLRSAAMPGADAPTSTGIDEVDDLSAFQLGSRPPPNLLRSCRGHGLRTARSTRPRAEHPSETWLAKQSGAQEHAPFRTRDGVVHFCLRSADGHLLQHKVSTLFSLAACTDRAGGPADADELRRILARIGTEALATGPPLEAESLRVECLWPVDGGSARAHDVEVLLVTSATPMAAVLDAPVLRVTASLPPNSQCGWRARLQRVQVGSDQLAPQLDIAHPSAKITVEHACAGASHLDTAAGLVVCPTFFEHRATFEALAAANAQATKPQPRSQAALRRDAELHPPPMHGSSHLLPLPSPPVPPSPHALHMAVASHELVAAPAEAKSRDDATARKPRPVARPPPMEGGAEKSEAMARLAQLGCDAAGARQLLLLRPVDRHPAP